MSQEEERLIQAVSVHLQVPDIEDTETVSQQFDVTPFRLWVIFQSVDSNGDGHVSKEELVDCLASTGQMNESVFLGRPALQQLWNEIAGEDREQVISFKQFCKLIRYLFLQQLLNESLDWKGFQGEKDYAFDCIDYSGTFYQVTEVPGRICPESRRFFTVPRNPQANMRWIDLPSSSSKAVSVSVLRLAVKYRFHPTAVEDVLELVQQQPKVNSFENSLLDLGDFRVENIVWINERGDPGDEQEMDLDAMPSNPLDSQTAHLVRNRSVGSTYGGISEEEIMNGQGKHYFIVIPLFELTERSAKSWERFGSSTDDIRESFQNSETLDVKPLVIEIKEATLAMFVASDPDPNLLITVSSKWRPTRIKGFDNADEDILVGRRIWRRRKSEGNKDKAALEHVKQLLSKRHSMQRHGHADWLMHAIIDAIVDNLSPISKIYEAQLEYLSARLMKLGHRWTEREVKQVIVMKRDLEWLQHELRPLQRVLRHLIDDKKIGVNVKHYLADIEDNLNDMQEQVESHARECERMKDEFNSYQDRRMNDILYVLTIVTTMVVPAQLLTGYFGMNFANENGDLGSPLLNLGSTGLILFWVITVVSTACVALVMYHFKLLEKPS